MLSKSSDYYIKLITKPDPPKPNLSYNRGMVKGGVPKQIDLTVPDERERVYHILHAVAALSEDTDDYSDILRRYPSPSGTYAKSQLLEAYRRLVAEGALSPRADLERRLRGRPVRTISGVTPVAVLTEPYPCPGKCIFCPAQQDAPKSYLNGEPGVLRALQYDYDPFAQTAGRITALNAIGHPVDKVELLILGGTWSCYPAEYQEWFLRRCFDAMNETESATLQEALLENERAPHRNVGLVIETRPDTITPQTLLELRRNGVTKVQLGAQSLDDRVLLLNQRGHTLAQTQQAVRFLRLGGFKVVLHWMPNLLGATVDSDLADFARLWSDPALRPDELKVYPTALIEGTTLYDLWTTGDYAPYEEADLIELLVQCKALVPPYCRINRLMRDIPASYIVAGTRKSNLRQVVQQTMEARGLRCQCIRCREVRGREMREARGTTHAGQELLGYQEGDTGARIEDFTYDTDATVEHFLQVLTPEGRLAGFLRLSLPNAPRTEIPISEIREAAMIREVHIYGPAQELGQRGPGEQHRGLGTQLLEIAAGLAQKAGFRELAVIAAVGTRPYYRERGFVEGELYPIRRL